MSRVRSHALVLQGPLPLHLLPSPVRLNQVERLQPPNMHQRVHVCTTIVDNNKTRHMLTATNAAVHHAKYSPCAVHTHPHTHAHTSLMVFRFLRSRKPRHRAWALVAMWSISLMRTSRSTSRARCMNFFRKIFVAPYFTPASMMPGGNSSWPAGEQQQIQT